MKLEVSLLPGETIDELGQKESPRLSDAELNNRYVQEGVRIVVEQARYPLNQIHAMFTDTFMTASGEKEAKYKRDPEYQRRHRWDDGRKSRLIESFLMNVPVPPVFLYEYELARFEVMDGRQRLTALMDFYSNSLVLTDLQYWPELNGRTHDTLPSSIRDGIDRRYLSSIILLNETAATEEQAAFLKKLVFERLNSGGVRLTGQETRNAVYNGPLNDLCLELSRTRELRAMLGTPLDVVEAPASPGNDEDPDDAEASASEQDPEGVVVTNMGRKMFESMEDVEIVLRFYAYRHLAKFSQGLNRISDFLDEFLVRGNSFDSTTLDGYRRLFQENIQFWYAIGGATAFQVQGSKRHFSKIAYDALMYASSALSREQRASLLRNAEVVRSAISQMYDNDAAAFGGRKTNTADAHRRNRYAIDALSTALAAIAS
ncbi:DUF262 domain-containing protein [Actinoallomurus sp. CA-142502]|uniref:DUF262 domain-containing protein n=1 Tax=Actinoallomurus sp. CA-142502 TaxID=3239885 RepID=UPI003D9013CA